ncbi:hypothetical protein BDZ94DRAFT_1266936 [Collybia nuda]|uniref:Uncharacterized protein n=1 Tax=Collybia nuda TaxID=64659 RepID=A0A9P6CBY2_9AGAR|nr:hypothetical protein BDZ94DRAFT_1266936 [Collybia nuda]
MAAELPLKIRVDIRDLWESPKSAVQKSVEELEKTLGYNISPQAQWPALWSGLKDRYPDKATFVPTVCRITIAWYERLRWRFESDHFPDWTEDFLNRLSGARGPGGKIHMYIEPSSTPQLQTTWKANTASFSLTIPKLDPPAQSKVESTFDKDFESIFTPSGDVSVNDDGWAEVASEPHAPALRVPPSQPSEDHPTIRRLPNSDTLPRPTELFAKTPPYFLKLDGNTIQCSHEPSLELLAAYLNKWGKTNTNDSLRRNVLKIELISSEFFPGTNDTLKIDYNMHSYGRPSINPTVILAFIEGVLGYKLIHTTGHTWLYKSDTLFK